MTIPVQKREPKLLDRSLEALRVRHMSLRTETEKAYLGVPWWNGRRRSCRQSSRGVRRGCERDVQPAGCSR